jgi:sodium-dependent dicarboxylate transporter 2/3/5
VKTEVESRTSQYVAICLGVVVLVLAFTLPAVGSLTQEMVRVLCLVVFALMFWVLQPIPIMATSLLAVVLMPILKIAPSLGVAFAGLSSPANYFVIASFGFGLALQKTSLSDRLVRMLLRVSQGKASRIALAFILATYIISMFISDIVAAVIMIGFVMEFLELVEDETEKRKLGKLLLICVPFGSILGGTATTVGSSINVLALNLTKAHAGLDVTFLQWVALGFPISIITNFACWRILLIFNKPADIAPELVGRFNEKLNERISGGRSKREPAILVVLGAIAFFWVVGSWIPWLDTTITAILGMALLFAPKIQAFSWNEFKNAMPWEIPIMGGATIGLGNAVIRSGLVDMLVNFTTETFPAISGVGFVVLIAVFVTILLLAIPVGPAVVSILVVPVFIMAEVFGLNPMMAVLVAAMFASNSTILPLNAVGLVSYSRGYWKISDMAVTGILTTIVWAILAALWIPFISNLVL